MTTLITHISFTQGISIISLLGTILVPFGISVPERSRINWVLVPLLELGPILDSKRTPTSARTSLIRGPRLLIFSASLPLTTLYACTINLARSILSCNMANRHSSSRSSDIPVKNLLISFLILDTREEAYLESLTNFKEYSLTYIPSWRRLMNSLTLASLCSL